MSRSKDYLAGRIEGLLYADQLFTHTATVYIENEEDFDSALAKAITDLRSDIKETDKEFQLCVSS